MKSVFCIVFLLVAVVGLSQTQWVPIKQTGNHFKALSANVEAGREYKLTTDFPFKGFIIKYDSEIDADAVTATVNNQLIVLSLALALAVSHAAPVAAVQLFVFGLGTAPAAMQIDIDDNGDIINLS